MILFAILRPLFALLLVALICVPARVIVRRYMREGWLKRLLLIGDRR